MNADHQSISSDGWMRRTARFLVFWFLAFQGLSVPASYATGITFPNAPLASDVTAVKPNVLFMVDDSPLMAQDYMPNSVENTTLINPATGSSQFGSCFSTADQNGSISSNPANCMVADPPYNAAAVNTLTYDPSISYTPPAKADGTSYPAQVATAAQTDPYGQQQADQLYNQVSAVNLTSQYPDRVWCTYPTDSPSDSYTCVTNQNTSSNPPGHAYIFPDGVHQYGFDSNYYPKYVTGGPYFYTLQPTTYCDNANLQNLLTDSFGNVTSPHCQDVSAPIGNFTFPAPVQWCRYVPNPNNPAAIDYTQVQTYYHNPANDCQGKNIGQYTYPRYLGYVTASTVIGVPYTTISVPASLAQNQSVTAIDVGFGGPNIAAGSGSINLTTTSSTSAMDFATSIASTSSVSIPPTSGPGAFTPNPWSFIACAGNSSTGVGCNQSPFAEVLVNPAAVLSNTVYVFPATPTAVGPIPVGPLSAKPYSITTGSYPLFPALYAVGSLPSVSFTIPTSNSYNYPIAVYDVMVNGVELLTSPVATTASGLQNETAAQNFAGAGSTLCNQLSAAAAGQSTVSCTTAGSGANPGDTTVTITALSPGPGLVAPNFTLNSQFLLASVENSNYAVKVSAPTAPAGGSYSTQYLIQNLPVLIGSSTSDTNALGGQTVTFNGGDSQSTVAASIATAVNGSGMGLSAFQDGGYVYIYSASNPLVKVSQSSTPATYVSKYCYITTAAMDAHASGSINSIIVNGQESLSLSGGASISLTPGESAAAIATDIQHTVTSNGFVADLATNTVEIRGNAGVTSCSNPTSANGANLANKYGSITASPVGSPVPAYVTGVFVNSGSNLLSPTQTEAAGTTANQVAQSIYSGLGGSSGTGGFTVTMDSPAANVVYLSEPAVDVSTLAVSSVASYGQLTIGNVSAYGPAQISSITVNGSNILPAPVSEIASTSGSTFATDLAYAINTTGNHPGGHYAIASGNVLYIYNPTLGVPAAPVVNVISGYGIVTTSSVATTPAYIRGIFPNGIAPSALSGTLTEAVGRSANGVAGDIVGGMGNGFSALAVSNNVYISKLGTDITSLTGTLDATFGQITFPGVTAFGPAQVASLTVTGTDVNNHPVSVNVLASPVNLAAGTVAATVAANVASAINSNSASSHFYATSSGATVSIYDNASIAITQAPTASIAAI